MPACCAPRSAPSTRSRTRLSPTRTSFSPSLSRAAALLTLLLATAASAQSYTVSASSAPYAPLTTPIVPVLTGNSDSGYAVIPIGFSFPYYGRTYSTVTITTDGLAYFEPNPGTSVYPTNTTLPSGTVPQGVIAPFWDNLEGSNTQSQLGYQLTTLPGGKVLTVEWAHWNHWSATATYDLSFQLRLHENGLIEFHYGTFTGAGQTLTATVGIENPTGTAGVLGMTCGSNCASTNVTANQVLTFGPGPNTIDLIASSLQVDSVTESSGILSITTQLGLSNFGSSSASGVDYALYLSSDTTFDTSDLPFSPATQGPQTISPLGQVTATATSTIARPAGGAWYVLAVVDPADAIAETNELNNFAATTTPLVSGVDLVAQHVDCNVTSSGPGEPVVSNLQFTNIGIDSAGAVDWKIYASTDAVLDTADVLMTSGSLSVAGGQTVSMPASYSVPGNLPAGTYTLLLKVQAASSVTELSLTNNIVASAATFTSTPVDLVVTQVLVERALPPYDPVATLYFGQPMRLEATVENVGGATARDFSLDVVLSANDVLSLFNDQWVGSVPDLTLAPGQSRTVVFTGTVPALNPANQPWRPGSYYFFATATGGQFVDADPVNNSGLSARQLIDDPGPDLTTASVGVQSEIASGELFPVQRVLRNIGNAPAATAKYRFVLSKNALISEEDLLLPIEHEDGTTSDDGEVTLGLNSADVATEWVRIPTALPAGDYYLGVFVDPDRLVREIDESNNGGVPRPVTVVQPRFAISSTPLQDAVRGFSYVQSITTIGGAPPVTFAIVGGTSLPSGIVLTPEGTLQGTPNETGAFPLVVEATDATGQIAIAALVVRVLPVTEGVTITSTVLPAPERDRPYRAALTAQGGRQPYRWVLESGALPEGLELGPTGGIVGTPTGPTNERVEFSVRVFDAVGNTALAKLSLTPVLPGSLYLSANVHPLVQAGADSVVDILANTADDEPLEGLQWSLVSGALPAGMHAEVMAPNAFLLRGTPVQTGSFPLSIRVVDTKNRGDDVQLVLEVTPSLRALTRMVPQYALRGQEVSGRFAVEGQSGHVTLRDGALPPGLSLAEDGTVSGRIADDAPMRLFAFTVQARLDSGETAISSEWIEVVDQLPGSTTGCGCDASSGPPPVWVFALLLLLIARRQ